ncbi:hypothetical protein [Uliginosibacterium gangwonense]|uniref:hypothetical protein n=1 Tax=Uliginosibacterium gangwonense TaxID=392736 RepID=UPI0012FA3FFC|nr:hypothetical protein [Uliginosibacterium gangwonense]
MKSMKGQGADQQNNGNNQSGGKSSKLENLLSTLIDLVKELQGKGAGSMGTGNSAGSGDTSGAGNTSGAGSPSGAGDTTGTDDASGSGNPTSASGFALVQNRAYDKGAS